MWSSRVPFHIMRLWKPGHVCVCVCVWCDNIVWLNVLPFSFYVPCRGWIIILKNTNWHTLIHKSPMRWYHTRWYRTPSSIRWTKTIWTCCGITSTTWTQARHGASSTQTTWSVQILTLFRCTETPCYSTWPSTGKSITQTGKTPEQSLIKGSRWQDNGSTQNSLVSCQNTDKIDCTSLFLKD